MDKLHCVNCGVPIPAKNVNIQTMMAVCERCDTVFEFNKTVVSKEKHERVEAPLTPIETPDGGFEVRYLHSDFFGNPDYVSLLMCVLIILVGGFFAVFGAWANRSEIKGGEPVIIFFGGAALICAYIFVGYCINRCHISMDKQYVKYFETPLPRFTNCEFSRNEIKIIYCKPIHPNQLDNPGSNYRLVLVLDDDIERVLIQSARRDIAFYMQQLLTERLYGKAKANVDEPHTLDELLLGDDGEVYPRTKQR